MIGGATQATSFGFENLVQQAWPGRQRAASRPGNGSQRGDGELTPEEQRQVDQLKEVDRKVKAHEQAHMAAGGDLIRGSANYSYETGPDNKRYAVAGDVSIDVSKERTPEETIPKAQRVEAAALAPSDPSTQDRRVAAEAARMEMQARQELAQQAVEERARAGSERGSRVIGAYQAAGGLEMSNGFSAQA